MSRRPKLLFLAYFFPPNHSVASIRSANIARQLSRVGWDVSVVTPDPSLIRATTDNGDKVLAEMDRLNIRRICTGQRWRCLSSGHVKRSYHGIGWFVGGILRYVARKVRISEHIGWYSGIFKACEGLSPDDVDVILATGTPWEAFAAAKQLSQKLDRPYVLDYRDLWSGDPHGDKFSTRYYQHLEGNLLKNCTAVSVVSSSMKTFLVEQFGVDAENVHVVPNGYDPSDSEDIEPFDFKHFAIVYTGLFIPPKRDVIPLMNVLVRLKETCKISDWRFHYYGGSGIHVRNATEACDLLDRVVIHDIVPYTKALSAIRGAGVAVVVTSVCDTSTLSDRGIITGKIFEPIGLGTPLLVIAPPCSDVENVIEIVGNGVVFKGSDIDGMATYLADLMRGNVPPRKHPELYSWPHLITKMDTMLRQAALQH